MEQNKSLQETISQVTITEKMGQGYDTAAKQLYSLEKSLSVGSNLNKLVNKKLGGKYNTDFMRMSNALGEILDIWEEIERDYVNMNN